MAQEHTHPGDQDPNGMPLLNAMHSFQRGDQASFDVVYGKLWPAVRVLGGKMGLCPEQSEDVAQKALVRVYLHANKAVFNHEKEVWGWLYTIARRSIYREWHQKSRHLVPEDPQGMSMAWQVDPGPGLTEVVIDREALDHAGDCIGLLSQADRLHLLGHLLLGLTFRQAAAVHGLSLGQFKYSYEKALREVRDCMKGRGYDFL